MNIVPIDRHDFETCAHLSKASDAEVIANLDELLGWTADINWPVASHVIDRIKLLDAELVLPIQKILASVDDTWKYFVIVYLISELKEDVFKALENDLERIVSNPTASEILEEVHLETKALLMQRKLAQK